MWPNSTREREKEINMWHVSREHDQTVVALKIRFTCHTTNLFVTLMNDEIFQRHELSRSHMTWHFNGNIFQNLATKCFLKIFREWNARFRACKKKSSRDKPHRWLRIRWLVHYHHCTSEIVIYSKLHRMKDDDDHNTGMRWWRKIISAANVHMKHHGDITSDLAQKKSWESH